MSCVHPRNWSKNYPTSLQQQDTRAVSHMGIAFHVWGTPCAHWVSWTDGVSETAHISGRASEAWAVAHEISKRRLMWPD
eukprot:11720417-Ditylum_brightwellii.AAC.1